MDSLSYAESCLLNNNYRALLTKQRTYAGFRNSHADPSYKLAADYAKYLINVKNRNDLLDPMAGYGSLMSYCHEFGANSYQVELNYPAYLWQLLVHPNNAGDLLSVISKILENENSFFKESSILEYSKDWFGETAVKILVQLYTINTNILSSSKKNRQDVEQLALAILLPFVQRLSTAAKSDYTHIKHSGVAIIGNYIEDYKYYLHTLEQFISNNSNQLKLASSYQYECYYGDASTYSFPQKRFTGMLTSPPYPNYVDYKKMFIVENAFVEILFDQGFLHTLINKQNTIGSNIVSGTKEKTVKSKIVKEFIEKLTKVKLNKKAQYDMNIYYIPYFLSYFSDLELAYENVIGALANDFWGYIIVSNNNIRNIEVPVSDFLIEFWQSKGFEAESIGSKSVAHLGDKGRNSRNRLMARHVEHTIEIRREQDG